MRKHYRKSLLTFIFVFYLTSILAQQSTVSSGNSISNNNGSVSYSLGQVAFITNAGSNGSTSQGVQQPFEFFVLTFSDKIIDNNIRVYPNPVNDMLTIQYLNYTNDKIDFQILDVYGKLIRYENIINSETQIDLSILVSGIYFVQVTNGFKEFNIFKIIKR